MSSERRRDPRYSVHIAVDCQTREMFVSNYVTNISKGGVFVRTDTPLPLYSEIVLTLALPGSERKIAARGKVAWTYDVRKEDGRLVPGMGIKFLDMSPADREAIEECLAQLPSDAVLA
jgi:type IV pilus assembly protein PilZ